MVKYFSRLYRRLKFSVADTPVSTVTAPNHYQVYQRSGSVGDITVSGVAAETCKIEARVDGGAYTTLFNSTSGEWSSALTSIAEGTHTVDVRMTGLNSGRVQTANFSPVGIGDVFVIGGQSNAGGRATYVYNYTGTPFVGVLGNDYLWKRFADPHDSNVNQVDTVSSDTDAAGSIWGLVGSVLAADQNVPIGFVPCAMGARTALQWQAGANHLDRTTLYGSLNYRAAQTGCKGIVFIEGESDVVNGTSKATFKAQVNQIVNDLWADRGVKTMFCKMMNIAGVSETNVNDAIGEIWAENANAVTGADFSGINPADGLHFKSQAEVEAAATLVSDAILAAWYP